MKKSELLSFFLILVIILAGFAFAGQVVLSSTGGTSFTINDGVSTSVNISVNNTDGAYENITAVVITLPLSVNFTEGTNIATAEGTFSNIANNTLNWTNVTGLIFNNSAEYFMFNVTPLTPGKNLNISVTVYTTNVSVNSSQTNLTLNVNDTFTATFNNPSNNYYNTSHLGLVNVSFSGNETPVQMNLTLYNSTALLKMNISFASPFIINYSAENITFVDGQRYYLNLTVNNSIGDSATNSRIVIIDKTAPTIEENDEDWEVEERTVSVLNITLSITDGGTGIEDCGVSGGGDPVIRQSSGNNWEIYDDEDLSCGNSYTYTVTCTDYASNSDEVEGTFSTSSCPSSSSTSPSSGGPSATNNFWTNTYVDDNEGMEDLGEVIRSLGKKQRTRLEIGGDTHYVGIVDLTTTTATVNVSSDPQQEVLSIGETAKFDVDTDNFYDLAVNLVGIASSKANLSINYLHESYVPADPEINTTLTQSGNETSTGASGEAKSATGALIVAILIILILGGILGGVIYYFFKIKGKATKSS